MWLNLSPNPRVPSCRPLNVTLSRNLNTEHPSPLRIASRRQSRSLPRSEQQHSLADEEKGDGRQRHRQVKGLLVTDLWNAVELRDEKVQ